MSSSDSDDNLLNLENTDSPLLTSASDDNLLDLEAEPALNSKETAGVKTNNLGNDHQGNELNVLRCRLFY